MSKRRMLAQVLRKTGGLKVLELMKAAPALYILNYHRVGDRTSEAFDREVYSGTADELDWQIKYLKRQMPIVGEAELAEFVSGRRTLDRLYGVITFDDGYLDNYTNAFEVLKANSVTGSFFLVPSYVGSSTVTWWDEIAYLVRNTPRRQLELRTPSSVTIATEPDREAAIHAVLKHYKQPANTDTEKFMRELREQAECALPPAERRFLNWDEARAMQRAGMTIGSHTQTHRILAQLTEEEQRWELAESKRVLEAELGVPVRSLAYPVGAHTAFTPLTETIAGELGYELAYSFYGGMARPGAMKPMDLPRGTMDADPLMARSEALLMTRLGKLPYA